MEAGIALVDTSLTLAALIVPVVGASGLFVHSLLVDAFLGIYDFSFDLVDTSLTLEALMISVVGATGLFVYFECELVQLLVLCPFLASLISDGGQSLKNLYAQYNFLSLSYRSPGQPCDMIFHQICQKVASLVYIWYP